MDQPESKRPEDGDEATALFQVSGKMDRVEEEARVYAWATRAHLPPGWQLADAATALSTLMMDIADRNRWSREDMLRAVVWDFVESTEDSSD
jgi:hypothetical protein